MSWEREPLYRYDRRTDIGDRNAVYEFNIKIREIPEGMTDSLLAFEAEAAIENFAEYLRELYPWVGDVGTAGRSGGWLAVRDKIGKATKKDLNAISRLVEKSKKGFVRFIHDEYDVEFAVTEEIEDSDEAWVFFVAPGRDSRRDGSLKRPIFARIDQINQHDSARNAMDAAMVVGPVVPVITRRTASLTDEELRTIGLAGQMAMMKMLPEYLRYVKRRKAHR